MRALPPGIVLRPARPEDIGARGDGGLRDLFNAVRRDERHQGRQPLSPPHYAAWRRIIDRQRKDGTAQALAAFKDGKPVAFCLARHPKGRDESSLDLLFVRPDMQGRGLGACLLDAVFEKAAGFGKAALALSAEAGPGRASGFYQAQGYKVTDFRCGQPPVHRLKRETGR